MEYSIINYRNVRTITNDFRIDADYFRPRYLKEDRQRAHFKNINIEDFAYVTDGQHGYHEVDESSPIFHLTAKNAKGWFANTEDADRLAKWVDDKNRRSSLKERDLILSTRGTVGLCALVKKEALPANIDQDVARIAVNAKVGIEPEFLLAYLNCAFGQDWLIRNTSGMVQQGLPLAKVRSIPIPLLSSDFQGLCKHVIEAGFKSLRNSETLYLKAEQAILSELGLLDWKPKHRLSFVKKFSDTQSSGRIDAEYFQPKYDEVVKAVMKYKGGFVQLGEVAKTKRGCLISDYFYDEREGIPYIRGADFSSGFLEDNKIIFINKSFKSKTETKIKKGEIVFTLIGTVGATALVNEKYDNAFISNNLGKIVTINYNSIVLQVLLHSIIGKIYFEKEQTQTAQPKISDKDIHSFILPLFDDAFNAEIEKRYLESHKTKTLSKGLLDIAKHGVEMAIEKSEKDAQNWIEAELKKLNVGVD